MSTAAAKLRVATLNCWNLSPPCLERMALARAEIARLQPDLIGLQEIIVRRDGFDQGEIILEGLGYEIVYGAAMRWTETESLLAHDAQGDAFGNLVASRHPIIASTVRELPGIETGERRSAVAVHAQTPWGVVPFITTHLNWKLDHGCIRERQVLALEDLVAEWRRGCPIPPIVVGDLNAEPESTELRFLTGLTSIEGRSTCLHDAWTFAGDGSPGYTWDNRNPFAHISFEPNRRIDYILVGPADLQGRGWVESARLAFTEPADGVFPSDHFGVVAEIRV